MIEMYLADDMDDGEKAIFLIDVDKMYVIHFNSFVYEEMKQEKDSSFIEGAELESEELNKSRMINPTLIKIFIN